MKHHENKWFTGSDVGQGETQSKCCGMSDFVAIWRISQKKVPSGKAPLTGAHIGGTALKPRPEHRLGSLMSLLQAATLFLSLWAAFVRFCRWARSGADCPSHAEGVKAKVNLIAHKRRHS